MALTRRTGTNLADILIGTPAGDLILGLGGTDTVIGDGDLTAGNGATLVLVGGDDQLDGGDDADTLVGDGRMTAGYGGSTTLNGGADFLLGGGGGDTMLGDGSVTFGSETAPSGNGGTAALNGGADVLIADDGADVIYGDGWVSGGAYANATLTGGADLIYAGGRDDTVYGDGTVYTYAVGNPVLIGADDVIDGGDGDDILYGDGTSFEDPTVVSGSATGGADLLIGGAGDDEIYGDGRTDGVLSGGSDEVFGNDGNDLLYGDGIAIDAVVGGDDRIDAGDGDDTVFGDGSATGARHSGGTLAGGNDWIDAGAGDDLVYGDGSASYSYALGGGPSSKTGDDVIFAGTGDDLIYGDGALSGEYDASFYAGADKIDAGAGDDTIYADFFVDTYELNSAVNGDDLVRGGAGDDLMWGDSVIESVIINGLRGGADAFVFAPGDGRDVVMDFHERQGDRIRLEGFGRLQLDSNRDGRIDAADDLGSVSAGSLTIDIGAAAGLAPGVQTVTLSGLRSISAGALEYTGSAFLLDFVNTGTDRAVTSFRDGDSLDATGVAAVLRGITASYVGDGDATDDDGSILFELYDSAGDLVKRQMESTAPFALFGDSGATAFNNANPALQDGDYQLKVTAYAGNGGNGVVLAAESVDFSFRSTPVVSDDFLVTLVDTGTEQAVQNLVDGATVAAGAIAAGRRGIVASFIGDRDPADDDGSIMFQLRDASGAIVRQHTENAGPFALFGDNGFGNYHDPNPALPDGHYSLTIAAYAGNSATGALLGSGTIDFTFG